MASILSKGRTAAVVTFKNKVYAYITWVESDSLLVFRHTHFPEAGIQVPGGSLEEWETPAEGVYREAREETGLEELSVVGFLGTLDRDLRPFGIDEIVHRYYFHVLYEGLGPQRWLHYEQTPSEGDPGPIEFEHFWVPIPNGVPELIYDMGSHLPQLYRRLGFFL